MFYLINDLYSRDETLRNRKGFEMPIGPLKGVF